MESISTVEVAKSKLTTLLDEGVIGLGSKLPSERELCELLGVKRMTLRQGLLGLEAEGRIFRKDRKGWFAALPRFNYNPNSSTSFKQAALAQGRVPSWGYISRDVVIGASADICQALQITHDDPVYQICGWGALDNHKVFYHQTWINPQVAPDFIHHLASNAFVDVWAQHYQSQIHTSHLAFKPTRLSGEACREIGGTASTPSILVEKYRANDQGRVVQIDIEYWRFESVDFFIDLEESK